MNQIPNIEDIKEDEMTPFESQLAQAILGALEYRGFYDCGKYLDTSLIEHIRPLFHQELQKARTDWLREEIEFVKQAQAVEPESNGRYNACNEILERYLAELDQDKQ